MSKFTFLITKREKRTFQFRQKDSNNLNFLKSNVKRKPISLKNTYLEIPSFPENSPIKQKSHTARDKKKLKSFSIHFLNHNIIDRNKFKFNSGKRNMSSLPIQRDSYKYPNLDFFYPNSNKLATVPNKKEINFSNNGKRINNFNMNRLMTLEESNEVKERMKLKQEIKRVTTAINNCMKIKKYRRFKGLELSPISTSLQDNFKISINNFKFNFAQRGFTVFDHLSTLFPNSNYIMDKDSFEPSIKVNSQKIGQILFRIKRTKYLGNLDLQSFAKKSNLFSNYVLNSVHIINSHD